MTAPVLTSAGAPDSRRPRLTGRRTVTRSRRWRNNAAGAGATILLALALAPLFALIGFTARRGLHVLSPSFLSHSMALIPTRSPGGGVYHAMIGTLEQVLLATLMAVPLGLLVAVFLAEQPTNVLTAPVRFLTDVMTGVPSIVTGLFVFSFWVVGLHRGFSGFAGAMALSILMLPVIVRTGEEMLRLVPMDLREASYALGLQRWRTVWSIVLPAARSGVTTGILLAIARVTGETAPLLLTVGNNAFINTDPFHGQQASLPVFVFAQTGRSLDVAVQRAWGGALVLIAFVVVLYLTARLLTRGAPRG
ncbi:MAG: phosphate transport system permease protein [Frankiaceae bacterium]|jgi:phosphate transport system permease protein|nr:phosphate transport system permease protein [Frankiaceae bacterium]